MKKIWFLVTILTLLGMFFATTQVLASPAAFADPKRTPVHTPGAQATERANERDTQGIGNPHGKRVNFKGTIAAVDASSLTLTLNDGASLTFILTADTRIKIPTLGQSATPANLSVGMQANVNATQDDTGTLTARIVLVVPGKPTLTHRVGTVTDYQAGISITIQAQDGKPYTFLLTAETKILPVERADQLVVGARVTVIAPRDVAGGTLTATGIVVHPAGTGGTHTPTPTYTPTPTDTPTPTATYTPTPTDTPTPTATYTPTPTDTPTP